MKAKYDKHDARIAADIEERNRIAAAKEADEKL